ncbi:MAG: MATE family efflux transporter, partial [Pseudomonadota bacterium]
PHYSTIFNFGRATLGTIPFVYFGSKYWGAEGVMIGQAGGGVIFGILAALTALRFISRKQAEDRCRPVANPAE